MSKTLAQLDRNLNHAPSDRARMRSAHKDLKESKENLISRFSSREVSSTFQEDYSEIIDQYFRLSIQESNAGQSLFQKRNSFAFTAVGGYGRKELCLYSDIDILILFNRKIPQEAKDLAEEIFYPLWDLGLELGYGIRTIKDCLTLCRNDFEVLTSMMDSRFICGDSLLHLTLMEDLQEKVILKKASAYGRWLEDLDRIRMNTFGDASHLLEPNLKEGIGGLRDYHHILWMAKIFSNLRDPKELEHIGKLSHKEYLELEKQVSFILLVRNHLHHLSGRRNDRLSFEYQEEIARRLDYKNTKRIPAVEQFLSRLHAYMEAIKILHHSFLISHTPKKQLPKESYKHKDISRGLHLYQNEVGFNSSTAILTNPYLLIEIFEKSSSLGCSLSMEARKLVTEFLYLVDDDFRRSEQAVKGFFKIINGKNTVEVLDQMCETGFLDIFLPEFGKIRNRVQFDAYHIFPVGRHVLETVRYLKNIENEKEVLPLDTFSDLSNLEPLFLSGLFHDIGKTGSNHAYRGSQITRKILERFNYSKRGTEEILFLIQNHLLLVETATRRDLNDEKVIVQSARAIGDIERLKLLYLLTWSDSKATGPRAWNEWIGNLVQELFFKVLHILEMGELATPDSSQKVNRAKSEIIRKAGDRFGRAELDRLFEVMSPRYILNTSTRDIVRHLELIHRLENKSSHRKSSAFIFDVREDKQGRFWNVCFIAKDRPGLFSDIAGVMTLNNINILSSNIYTWREGTAVDIFSVTRPLDSIHPNETWEKVERDFENTFNGKLSLSYRLSQKASPSILSSPKKPTRPPEVVVDNRSSDFFTLVEVFASDRVGLLYLITRSLFDLRLDIRIAKTGVKGDQIADVFYVRDLEGQKLEDEEQVKEVKRALLYQLNQ